jgi:pyridoxine 5-phosphate synthase
MITFSLVVDISFQAGVSAMTTLSININKIALLRNSRGRNFPDVRSFAARCLTLGADGITLHPRPDQRHARYDDVLQLQGVCKEFGRELNVEGYPSAELLSVVKRVRPSQCTLVPDDPNQLTSDHGWDLKKESLRLRRVIGELKDLGVRVSLFMDFDAVDIELAKEIGADRVELYTEPYAQSYGATSNQATLDGFRRAAERATNAGLGVNAGHDLSLENLARFLAIPNILEVSIGHAFVVECVESGIESVTNRYLAIIGSAQLDVSA